MSYVVFALKWRPKIFSEIVGQPHIVSTLTHAIESKRLAHAYLFSGPRGVGKTTTARILAKALNCVNGPTANPCGQCPSCTDIGLGRSLDVMEIDGASNRGIDEVRTLRENVKFAPTQGKFKVYIIDEVHMLTQEAFNALLKTLEEPPEFVKFIFATTQPNKVIPTILSRCQRFDFRRIPVMEIIAQLELILKAEGIVIDRPVLLAVARGSDGSLRDAETLLDQIVSVSGGKTALKDVVALLGLVEQDALFNITEAIIKKDPRAALKILNTIIDEGKDTAVFLSNLIEHMRNLMVAKITKADASLVDLPEDVCKQLLAQSQGLSLEEILNAFGVLVNAQELARRLDSQRIPLEVSLVKLAQVKPAQAAPAPAGGLISRPSAPPAHPATAPRHPPPAAAPKPLSGLPQQATVPMPRTPEEGGVKTSVVGAPPARIVGLEQVQAAWQELIADLSKVKMSAATFLGDATLAKVEDNIITLSFPKGLSLHKDSLERKDNKAILEKICSDRFAASMRVALVLSKEDAVKKEDIHDEYLKSVLSAFNGRVVKEE